jgi:ribosomal protein S18 acetylase RimI-like enzyme
MEETEKIAQQRGFKKLNLSVATDNLKAISFYEKLGWRKVIEKDQWQGRMIKELP